MTRGKGSLEDWGQGKGGTFERKGRRRNPKGTFTPSEGRLNIRTTRVKLNGKQTSLGRKKRPIQVPPRETKGG